MVVVHSKRALTCIRDITLKINLSKATNSVAPAESVTVIHQPPRAILSTWADRAGSAITERDTITMEIGVLSLGSDLSRLLNVVRSNHASKSSGSGTAVAITR